MTGLWHWLGYWTGISNEAGRGYGFWSGIGSCLTYVAVPLAAWRHLNCHARSCWRVGRHPVEGTPYKVCRRHHPDVPPGGASVEHIHAAHRRHQERNPA